MKHLSAHNRPLSPRAAWAGGCLLLLTWSGVAAASASAAAQNFHFAIIGDRTGSAVPGVYEAVVDEVNLLRPDFEITVGDHIQGYTEDTGALSTEWGEYKALTSRLKAPIYVCPGNHDITSNGMVDAWRAQTGHEPSYSFDRDGVHFVIFDTGRWETTKDWWEQSGYRDWLAKDLAAHAHDRLTVVIFHKPYWYNTVAEGKPDSLHALFRRTGVDYVFNGHFHLYGTAVYDGIHYTIVGSSGGAIGNEDVDQGSFFQYLWCSVEGDSLDWAVLKKGSALPPKAVTVPDLKFFEAVSRDYVRLSTFRLNEQAGAPASDCVITIKNATPNPWETGLVWEAQPNWSIQPPSGSLSLAPGAESKNTFAIKLQGKVYPLPVFRMDYPYRPGKVYKVENPLSVLRTQTVGRLRARPAIDGSLNEPAWSGAQSMTDFGSPEGGSCTIEGTELRLGYDETNLYVGARARQADLSALVTGASTRDGAVTRDDCIGMFLCADPAETTFVQIYFNSRGVVFDQKLTARANGETGGEGPAWNGTYEAATSKEAGAWFLEAALPFQVIGAKPPASGDQWRANFRRKEISKSSSADWQYPIGFEPAKFGYLRFE